MTSAWVGATQFLKATYQTEEVGDNVTDFAFMEFYHCRDIVVSLTIYLFYLFYFIIFLVLCSILQLLVLHFLDHPLLPPLLAL